MANYSLLTTMFIALVFLFSCSLPSSLGHREESDNETIMRDLCSQINRTRDCVELIKSELSRFENSNCSDVAGPVLDLAREKAEQIRDMLKQLHNDSNDDKLKEKYESCSSNYNDASRDLDVAKTSFDSNDYQNITQVDDIVHELDECTREFDEGAFDPAHVGDRNNEFEVYVELVKVAVDRLLQGNVTTHDGDYDHGDDDCSDYYEQAQFCNKGSRVILH